MNNKITATSFLNSAAMGNPAKAFNDFVAPEFIHHNQYFKGDRASLLVAMEQASKNSPNRIFTIKQVIEEGDRVVTYSHVIKDKMQIAVVHIFRFELSKIVELWDLGQIMDENSPNQHGMF